MSRFSYDDLKQCVDTFNIARLREILGDRDPATGRPRLDINAIVDGSFTVNLLSYMLNSFYLEFFYNRFNETHRNMLFCVLAVRDNHHNVVVDLNMLHYTESMADELFNFFRLAHREINCKMLAMKALIEAIINLRDPQGNSVFDINLTRHVLSPLHVAVYCQDVDLVRLLLDLRKADGSYAIDVNLPGLMDQKTPLDVAYTGSWREGSVPGFVPSVDIVQLLEERDAVRFSSLTRQEKLDREKFVQEESDALLCRVRGVNSIARPAPPVPVIAQPPAPRPVIAQRAPRPVIARPAQPTSIQAFSSNPQNTHNPEVERSVDFAIDQLNRRYQSVKKLDFNTLVAEIKRLIDNQKNGRLYNSEAIGHITRGFAHVLKSQESRHLVSGLTLQDIVCLIWCGICDEEQMPEDFPLDGDKKLLVDNRKTALLDKFLEIATTYPDGGTSCIGGTRNLIVSALHKAHPDVCITPTTEAVKELGLEHAKRFMCDQLKKYPIKQQRAILRTWNELDDEEGGEKTAATQFREEQKPLLVANLNEHLISVLPVEFFTELKTHYEDFPEPVTHKALAKLCEEIKKMPKDLYEGVDVLKQQASPKVIFRDTEDSFDSEYQKLKKASDLPLRFLKHKSALDQLIGHIKIYLKDKTEVLISRNVVKSKGARALLNCLATLSSLDSKKMNQALDFIETTLSHDEQKYFSLRFDTWFFVKERHSTLKGFFEQAQRVVLNIIADQRARSSEETRDQHVAAPL